MAKVKPSFTAFLIPKILPAISRDKRYSSLLTKAQVEISRRFARECARNDLGIALIHYLTGRRLAIWLVNNIGIKGLSVHYAARKKYIRDKFQKISGEISQVVMIGAGFDTLCAEYHKTYAQIKFFELDQYSTQKIKLDALKKMPDAVGGNLKFIACDLSKESLQTVLKANDFIENAKTFFVIEGVIMYLQKADVEKLFEDIHRIGGEGSYMIFGSMDELKTENDIRAKLSDAALAAQKEKYKFGARPEEIKEFLADHGFRQLETRLYHELQQGVVSDAQVASLQKERGEHYYFVVK